MNICHFKHCFRYSSEELNAFCCCILNYNFSISMNFVVSHRMHENMEQCVEFLSCFLYYIWFVSGMKNDIDCFLCSAPLKNGSYRWFELTASNIMNRSFYWNQNGKADTKNDVFTPVSRPSIFPLNYLLPKELNVSDPSNQMYKDFQKT